MSRAYRNIETYSEIINTIGKWKIIECQDLYKYLMNQVSYKTLKNKIKYLEKLGIVKGIFVGNKKKHVYLTDIGIQFTRHDKTYEPIETELLHDLLTGKILHELMNYSGVIDVTMYHQLNDYHINPDGVIRVFNDGEEFTIAIEVELNQKSQKRVKEKYSKIGKSQDYDYCFFISNKEKLINTYKRYLSEMEEEVRNKIMFIEKENLSSSNVNLLESKCFYLGEEVDLVSMLGKK